MYCKHCGNKIDNDALFCSQCGKQQHEGKTETKRNTNSKIYDEPEKIIIEKPKKELKRPPKSVSFFEALKNYYANYTNFKGRAVKTEFWYVMLYNFIISSVLIILAVPVEILYVWSIINFIPGLSLPVRRLHDTGRSASYLWYLLIPLAGVFIHFYFYCCDSDYDNRWGLSPHETMGNSSEEAKKTYDGYSAVTKDAEHIWKCDCGAKISVTPCPFCGKEHHKKVLNEQGLKDYIIYLLYEKSMNNSEREFYKNYLDCVYNSESNDNTVSQLKSIIENCTDYIEIEYIPIIINVCEKKLLGIGFWRCKGCGEILPISQQDCLCGYKFG